MRQINEFANTNVNLARELDYKVFYSYFHHISKQMTILISKSLGYRIDS